MEHGCWGALKHITVMKRYKLFVPVLHLLLLGI